jgi:energy-coupling factor transport system permease protein
MKLSYSALVVKGGFLRSINPIVKIVCAVLMFVACLLIHDSVALILYFLFVLLLMVISRMGKPALKLLAAISPFALFVGAANYVFSGDVTSGVQTFFHIMFLGAGAAFFTFSTTPAELVQSMETSGVPRMLTMGTLVTIRFLPVFLQELMKILQSLRMRGGRFKRDAYFYYRAVFIPLIYKIFMLSDAITLSLYTRGFSLEGKRTNYREIRFGLRDVSFTALFLAVTAGAVI